MKFYDFFELTFGDIFATVPKGLYIHYVITKG